MKKSIWTLPMLAALAACNATHAEEAPTQLANTPNETPEAKDTTTLTRQLATDAPLRQAYGPSKMKLADCVKLDEDTNALIGENCQPGLMLYGPYVPVPADSELQVKFELTAPKNVTITGDMVSMGGKQFHGALSAQQIVANERKTISHAIHTDQSLSSAETRIWVRGEAPINFKITNLTVGVQ